MQPIPMGAVADGDVSDGTRYGLGVVCRRLVFRDYESECGNLRNEHDVGSGVLTATVQGAEGPETSCILGASVLVEASRA